MKIQRSTLLVLLLSLCLVVSDVEAGWKFWKKKETTVAPEATTAASMAAATTSTPTPTPTPTPTTSTTRTTRSPPRSRPGSPSNTGGAILGAADPGLAIGLGSSGQDIRNNARPSRPNPGTEVGLDLPAPKPGRPGTGGATGQGYRDWAVDLTGAGEPGRQPPKLPGQGPAFTNAGGSSIPSPGPGANAGQTGPQPGAGRPAIGGGNQASSTTTQSPRRPPSPGGHSGSPNSGYPALPGSPGTRADGASAPGSPGSPQPGKTWADVAGGGGRPDSATRSPTQPGHPSQPAPNQTPRPQTPRQPGHSPGRPSTGAITGGALAGAGAAAAAAGTGAGVAAGTTSGTTGKTYSSNPTYSKGTTITDEDLEKLAEALYIKDTNNANQHITLALQKQTSSGSPTDEAPQPLFSVNQQAYQIPTVQRVVSIFDNYQLDTHTNEYISPAQREEESLLVDTFLSTNVMSAAMRFLADKGHVRKDYYEYKDTLRKLWFNLFSRGQGKIGSTGFEHVFMTELKPVATGTEVIGLHNWIYYSLEEVKRRADYLGYIKKLDLGNKASILKIHTKFDGHDKPVTTMFVGTSPELEMALYTVCFYARPDAACPVSLGGTKFNIVTHRFRYRGNDLVGTAYPDI